MLENLGRKEGQIFNEGVLSQFKKTEEGFKVVTHLDKLPEPFNNNTHIETKFDKKGNPIDNDFNYKFKK